MTDVIDVDEAEATDISTPVLEAPGLRRRRRATAPATQGRRTPAERAYDDAAHEVVTLGDAPAKAEAKKSGFGGMQKVKAQRSGPATFDIIVELRRGEQHEWRIIMDAGKAVDGILEGQ